MNIADNFADINGRIERRQNKPTMLSDSEALLCVADNIDGFWCDLAESGVLSDKSGLRDVARAEAAHLREIAARIKGR